MENKSNVDWDIYSRVNETKLVYKDPKKEPTLFKGVIIGRRTLLGLMDYIGSPLIVLILVSGYPLYANKTIKDLQPTWLATTIFYGMILIGIILSLIVFLIIFRAKKTNDREGTGSVYINFETQELGIRDADGYGQVIPLSAIDHPAVFRLFNLQIGPVSIRLYARLILFWKENGRKRITFVHFMDDPDDAAQLIFQITHEKNKTIDSK
jgi:hypothetical protein